MAGLEGLPEQSAGKPILFVGNHQVPRARERERGRARESESQRERERERERARERERERETIHASLLG